MADQTILVVDDERHIRELVLLSLEDAEEAGVTVHAAGDGEEALKLIESVKPDLIFLDVMMPRLNGFDVCQRVRADEARYGRPHIVLLTAKGQDSDRQKGLTVGADEYMTKPFSPIGLIARTREVLGL